METTWRKGFMRTILLVLAFSIVYFTFINPELISTYDEPHVQAFKTFVISLLLEAIPFLLIGVVVSSILNVFVPDDWIKRILPRHPLLAILVASLVGIILPLCECGMIPIARSLMKKGLPTYAALTYVVASPLINPIVFSSTLVAFRTDPSIAYMRMGVALVCAFIVGFLIYKLIKYDVLRETSLPGIHTHAPSGTLSRRIYNASVHMGEEFMNMGKYLLLGVVITSAFQAFIGQDVFSRAGHVWGLDNVFMMVFAYVISLCSNTDAFIASTFQGVFDKSSLLSFMVFGAMLDFKTTLMLLSTFKRRFVFQLSLIITITVLMVTIVLKFWT